jgi:hypothetical protein
LNTDAAWPGWVPGRRVLVADQQTGQRARGYRDRSDDRDHALA